MKKIISSPNKKEAKPAGVDVVVEAPKVDSGAEMSAVRTKRKCLFCESKTNPSYADIVTLKRFMTDRARIVPKMRSGACAKHQRRVASEIKRARHLALLPFVPTV